MSLVRRSSVVVVFAFALISALLSPPANAGSLTYSGRIVDSANVPVAASVAFTVAIKAHNGTCVLYQETQNQTISASANGGFGLRINGASSTRNDGTGNSFDAIFSNQGTLNCSAASGGGTYSPGAADKRYVSVTFDDGGGAEALPTQEIAAVPGALESSRVGGFVPASLARVSSSGTIAAFSQSEANELTKLVQGTSAQYAKNAANGAISVGSFAGNPSSPATGQFGTTPRQTS